MTVTALQIVSDKINQEDFNRIVTKKLIEIIESNYPHKRIYGEDAFENMFGSSSYDYSGTTAGMDKDDLLNLLNEKDEPSPHIDYKSDLDYVLKNIYTGKWLTTSVYGKFWVSYMNLLENEVEEWIYDNFNEYVHEDSANYVNGLSWKIQDIVRAYFEDFICKASFDYYLKQIEKKLID